MIRVLCGRAGIPAPTPTLAAGATTQATAMIPATVQASRGTEGANPVTAVASPVTGAANPVMAVANRVTAAVSRDMAVATSLARAVANRVTVAGTNPARGAVAKASADPSAAFSVAAECNRRGAELSRALLTHAAPAQ